MAFLRELTAVPERGRAVGREKGNIGVSRVVAPIFGTGPSQLVRAGRIGPAARGARCLPGDASPSPRRRGHAG